MEILSCKFDPSGNMVRFAVDLCKDTQPYQLVLAMVPRGGTLGETLTATQKDISDFKNDPHYQLLRRLSRIDRLRIPDVLCKLRHDYRELLGKNIGNAGFESMIICEAMQTIDFKLNRAGALLKSEARLGGRSARGVVEMPREFYFDKPFLIYVKKRQPDAKPFFVMWVDNAELMTAFAAAPQRAGR
jgi:hypothetical protein